MLPTVSCLTILAICDALALAIVDRLGATVEDFAANHPGGALGRGLNIRVAAITLAVGGLQHVASTASFADILRSITMNRCGATLVVDAGILVGIITDGDVRRASQRGLSASDIQASAADIMTRDAVWIDEHASLVDAAAALEYNTKKPVTVAVVRGAPNSDGAHVRFRTGEAVCGLVRLHDIVQRCLMPHP